MLEVVERLTALCLELLEMVREMAGIISQAGITVIGSDYAGEIRRIEEEMNK